MIGRARLVAMRQLLEVSQFALRRRTTEAAESGRLNTRRRIASIPPLTQSAPSRVEMNVRAKHE